MSRLLVGRGVFNGDKEGQTGGWRFGGSGGFRPLFLLRDVFFQPGIFADSPQAERNPLRLFQKTRRQVVQNPRVAGFLHIHADKDAFFERVQTRCDFPANRNHGVDDGAVGSGGKAGRGEFDRGGSDDRNDGLHEVFLLHIECLRS